MYMYWQPLWLPKGFGCVSSPRSKAEREWERLALLSCCTGALYSGGESCEDSYSSVAARSKLVNSSWGSSASGSFSHSWSSKYRVLGKAIVMAS